jgi:hypothetical protein
MSKSHREEEAELKASIEANLQTTKNAIDDYELTLDSTDFSSETAKLRDDLLKSAVKYHILTSGSASRELRKVATKVDPKFADELKILSNASKGDRERLMALQALATEVASELMSTIDAIGAYKLSPDELDKRAAETLRKARSTTETPVSSQPPQLSPENTKQTALKRKAGVRMFEKGERKSNESHHTPKLPRKE